MREVNWCDRLYDGSDAKDGPEALLHEMLIICEYAAIQQAIQEGWIRSTTVASSHALSILLRQLHRGEAEAITLAGQVNADILLIDEQEGRQFASQTGLSITGVLGVLLRAKSAGDIASLKHEIRALRTRANFFIAEALETKVLAAAGE
jgi:uncharacterized protein